MKQEIIRIAHHLYHKNLLTADDGSISYRYNNTEILITPSNKAKSQITTEDIAIITIDGQIKKGLPSRESILHCAIYQLCAEAKCVIHAHPPKATAWTIARADLQEFPANKVMSHSKCIPIIPQHQHDNEMFKSYLPEYRLMLLARNGAITWSEDLQEALNGMERLEHAADILIHAAMISDVSHLLATETHHAA